MRRFDPVKLVRAGISSKLPEPLASSCTGPVVSCGNRGSSTSPPANASTWTTVPYEVLAVTLVRNGSERRLPDPVASKLLMYPVPLAKFVNSGTASDDPPLAWKLAPSASASETASL